MIKKYNEFINESNIKFQKSDSKSDFEKYSGTNCKDAERFLNKCIKAIPEWKQYTFELFYSGYAGYTIYNKKEEVGYLMYEKNQYGLEDCSTGRGWYYKPSKIDDTNLKWRDIVKDLSDKDPSKPEKARLW